MAKNKIEIPNLILDHLLQYGDTSILGLGTLYYSYQSAYLSDDKSKVFPPSNTLQFRDDVEDTDQFIAYVSNRLGVSQKKALDKVDKYAQHIINSLLNYGKATIPSVGQFIKGDSEDITFLQNFGAVNSEFFGLMPVKLQPIHFIKDSDKSGVVMAVSTAAVPNRNIATSTIAPTTIKNSPTSYNYNDEDDSSWLKPLLWMFGLILLSALLYKGCESYKSKRVKTPVINQVDSVRIVDSQKGNEIGNIIDSIESRSETEESTSGTAPTIKRTTECVIILGAFESARNAMKMSTKVTKLGFTPYEEYFDTMDVTRVGFKFDCSEKDLQEFMHEVRKDIAKDAWYLVPRITVD